MKLTEDMVIARSRGAELHSIRKLNCWGSEISDVSVVRKLPNIEVLALSVNNVSTLADFQYCENLTELYIRQNNIKDLNEVMYLKELPKLKSLWLADNPCAKRDDYRMTLLRALPHLQKLDNTPVESEEVQKAMIHGEDLVHPLDTLEQSQEPAYNERAERAERAQRAETYDREPAPPQSARSPDYYPSQQQQQPQSYQQASYREQSPQYYEPPAREQPAYYEDSRSPTDGGGQRASFSSYRDSGGYRDSGYREARRSVASPDRQYAATAASDGDGYRGSEAPPTSRSEAAYSEHGSLRQYGEARPKRKSPNVLSAVLCLVKELDLHGLEVVETAIRCRIQELED